MPGLLAWIDVGDHPLPVERKRGLFFALLAGIGSVAASSLAVEVLTDRDWTLSGLEWPETFLLAGVVVSVFAWVFVPAARRPLFGGSPRAEGARTRFHLPPDSALEHAGLRWFVSVRRTVSISLRRRELCLARYRDGIASCRYGNGMVLPFSMPRTPEQLEEHAATFFRAYRPRAEDVIVDAGAGIGDEVLVFARLVGRRGRVISIEAHPASFERLAALCRLNRLKNVTCIHAALLDASGTAQITDQKQAIKNSVVTPEGTIPVPAQTLDRLLTELGVRDVDFLKLNIEGAELRALLGFTHGLRRTRHLAVACHDRRAESGESDVYRTKKAVRALLESHGLSVRDGATDQNPWDRDYLYANSTREPLSGGGGAGLRIAD
jgi:FkbM family methyltransferase